MSLAAQATNDLVEELRKRGYSITPPHCEWNFHMNNSIPCILPQGHGGNHKGCPNTHSELYWWNTTGDGR